MRLELTTTDVVGHFGYLCGITDSAFTCQIFGREFESHFCQARIYTRRLLHYLVNTFASLRLVFEEEIKYEFNTVLIGILKLF